MELTYVLNKTHSLKHFVYLVGLHIYYKIIHGHYNIKLVLSTNLVISAVTYVTCIYKI